MELMIGAGLALALLYFWLIGHWFARVVVFLCLAFPVLLFAGDANASRIYEHPHLSALATLVIGCGIAWIVASGPMWVLGLRQRIIRRA